MPRKQRHTHICENVGRWRTLFTIEVTFSGDTIRSPLSLNMVIDTGAEDVGLPISIFKYLNLPVLHTVDKEGAGATYTSRISEVDITVDGQIFVPKVRVSTVADVDSKFGGLLGLSFLNKVGMFADFGRRFRLDNKKHVPFLLKFYCDAENYLGD